jgi:hypothetical protein
MPNPHDAIRTEPVVTRRQLDRFIRLPWSLYGSDPQWVPPLIFELKQRLSKHNPFFRHARWQAFTAWQGNNMVGRISAQIDDLYLQHHPEPAGYFGMLEAIDDPGVFTALFDAAETWLRDNGMREARGPFNLSINEECGLLVDGFDTPPCIMMGHARPYYGQQVETCGYNKARDLLAYTIPPDFDAPRVMLKLAERAVRTNVRVRPLERKQLKQELEVLRDIFNDAWSNNWGFVPFTAAEFSDIGKMLTLLVDDDFVQIAELDGEPVAFIVALPNVNAVIHDLNGRLLPLGWLKLLWRLKAKFPTSARVPLMGVRRSHQQTRLGPTLAFLVIDAVRQALIRRGVTEVELSWILEDNDGMRNIIETIGGVAYKRYRVYQKSL